MDGDRGLPDVAIVGGSTLLGKELKELLEASDLPLGDVLLLSTRDEEGEDESAPGLSARLTDFAGEALVETPITADDVAHSAMVFLCEPGAASHPALAAARLVVDMTGEPSERGAAVVAGVNAVAPGSTWIRSPHPATVLLAHLLAALPPGTTPAAATLLLGASDAGRPGVDELMAQSQAALNMTTGPRDVFGAQLAFNLLPPFSADAALESRIEGELASILDAHRATVALVRVPIFFGIACCLHVPALLREEALGALRSAKTIALRVDEDASALDVPGEDGVIVGRVRAGASGTWIWALCDNARRGGALNALEAARSVLGV